MPGLTPVDFRCLKTNVSSGLGARAFPQGPYRRSSDATSPGSCHNSDMCRSASSGDVVLWIRGEQNGMYVATTIQVSSIGMTRVIEWLPCNRQAEVSIPLRSTHPSSLDETLQTSQRLVPFRRNRLQMAARVGEAFLLELPHALAAMPHAPDETRR